MPLSEAHISILRHVRLLIAVAGKYWHADFGMCLAMMCQDLSSPLSGVKDHAFSLYNTKGSILPQVREELADIAVKSKSTHVLFLDTDHSFPKQLARVLISRRCDVIAVNCVTKTVPAVATARSHDPKNFAGSPVRIQADAVIPVQRVWRVGMGAMLVDVDVFHKLKKPYFGTRWDEEQQHHVGEDWWFCERLEEAGIPIHIDNQLSPLVTHIGDVHFHWEMQAAPQKEEETLTSSLQVVGSLAEVGL